MSIKNISYGIRKCMHCHKEFEAFKPSAITCSPECHKARKRQLDRILKQKRLKPDDLDWLNKKHEELKNAKDDVGDLLTASAFIDFADADDDVQWLNCRIESLLGELRNCKIKLSVVQANLDIRIEEVAHLKSKFNSISPTKEGPKANSAQEEKPKGKGKFEHVCDICGNYFRSTRMDARFCSEECKREAAEMGL